MKQKIVLIVSIVIGLLAALLTRGYLAAKENEFNRMKAEFARTHGVMDVVVFTKDCPSGTVLDDKMLGVIRVPRQGLEGRAVDGDKARKEYLQVYGHKLLVSRKKDELLFWADIEGGKPHNGGLSDDVKRQMRALSISVSGAASVSGMVKPNDHVDVIATFSIPREGATVPGQVDLVTSTILQNVLVLATGTETAKSQVIANYGVAGRQGYNTVTLEVTPREAEMLVFSEQMKGRLSLALRNRSDVTYEKELPKVDFDKIQSEIEELNLQRQKINLQNQPRMSDR